MHILLTIFGSIVFTVVVLYVLYIIAGAMYGMAVGAWYEWRNRPPVVEGWSPPRWVIGGCALYLDLFVVFYYWVMYF